MDIKTKITDSSLLLDQVEHSHLQLHTKKVHEPSSSHLGRGLAGCRGNHPGSGSTGALWAGSILATVTAAVADTASC